jgi:molecular chaperone Hsp33
MPEAERDRRRIPAAGGDDLVLPFHLVASRLSGRLVRLGPAVDTILTRHDYPEPVGHALGEALALTALMATALRFDSPHEGRFIFQTKADGPLGLLVVHYDQPGKLRGYAAHDKARTHEMAASGRGDQGRLIGRGTLAMTIDPGGELDRYQGIVPLEGRALVDAALAYFRQSEQLPTFIRLAVARHYGAAPGETQRTWHWRAGGLMIQQLPREGGRREAAAHREEDDAENWNRARHLAATVEDHELLDPLLSPERLLYRLFHEEGVRVTPATALAAECRCSRERIHAYLQRFGAEELKDLREPDGGVTVTCEFCSRKYRFSAGDVD